MNPIKINKASPPGKKYFLLLMLFFYLLHGSAFSQTKKKKKTRHWEFRFGLTTTYDDNILKYSKKYLDRFMNREDEGRFHIDTYDDLIVAPSLGVSYTKRLFGKRKSVFSTSFSHREYVVNKVKNWNYWGIGFRQYFPKRISAKILYSYIPDFYVRHFRDDQWIAIYGYNPISFQPYAFSKDNYGLWVQKYFFKNTRVKLSLYYSQYFHNEHYTEYNSKNLTYGVKVYQSLHKQLKLELGYNYITSDAKGYDASYETPETTHGPDATYAEDQFSAGLAWKLPKLKKHKNDLDLSVNIMNRYYSSKHPAEIDRLHAGRVDKNLRFYFNYHIEINKALDITAFYYWLGRDTDTQAEINKDYISNEKDYRQDLMGIKLSYVLKR